MTVPVKRAEEKVVEAEVEAASLEEVIDMDEPTWCSKAMAALWMNRRHQYYGEYREEH